tara:strand:+ start:38898 stop:39293 length:396 start_codon:yes stop_codon:yes gene_type:complete
MSEGLSIFGNIRTLRKEAKDYDLEALYEMRTKLNTVIQGREDEIAAQEAERKEKQNKIEAIKAQMAQEGLTMEDIVKSASEPKINKPKTKRPIKYSITVDGEEHKWTGIGRMPRVYQEALESGKKLEDFAI